MGVETEARKLYGGEEGECLSAAARKQFPGYNNEESLDGLESAVADRYEDDQWQSIAEHLSNHVLTGVT